MFKPIGAFSGFSVKNLETAKEFYGKSLGLTVENSEQGLQLELPHGGKVFVYSKPDHAPASFTILNFVVEDIDAAVDALKEKDIVFEIYDGIQHDNKGIARGFAHNMGPDIAWFTDPDGNIMAVLQTK